MARSRIVVALAVAGCAKLTASAQGVMVDIGPCVAIGSAVERLACYDELAKNVGPGSDSARAVDGESRPRPSAAVRVEAEPLDELTSTVVALHELQPGRLEITLANGEVWRQTHSDRYRLQVGHEVRLYRASSHAQYVRLTAPALRGFVQVERVR